MQLGFLRVARQARSPLVSPPYALTSASWPSVPCLPLDGVPPLLTCPPVASCIAGGKQEGPASSWPAGEVWNP
jgi:hypothetical protein